MSYHITTIVLCQKYHVDWCDMADAIHIKYAFCFKFQWGTPSSSINFNSSRCHPGVRTLDRDVTFSCVSFPVMKYQIQCSSGGKIEIYVFASMHYVVFLTLNIIFSQHVSVCFADPKHAWQHAFGDFCRRAEHINTSTTQRYRQVILYHEHMIQFSLWFTQTNTFQPYTSYAQHPPWSQVRCELKKNNHILATKKTRILLTSHSRSWKKLMSFCFRVLETVWNTSPISKPRCFSHSFSL